VEVNSVRATCRTVDVDKGTVLKLLVDIGTASAGYQDQTICGLTCKRIECDEIWSFCYAKEKNVPGRFGYGDVWTWMALCADCKLVPSWLVAKRDAGSAFHFINDLAGRLASRVQLTTDGYRVHLEAVESTFGSEIDYAMLVKLYGADAPRHLPRRHGSSMIAAGPTFRLGEERTPCHARPCRSRLPSPSAPPPPGPARRPAAGLTSPTGWTRGRASP
jgi:hypothetical protein